MVIDGHVALDGDHVDAGNELAGNFWQAADRVAELPQRSQYGRRHIG
ncbi:hypothetical protein [Micromonospora sp. NPDC048830]